jgi:hypothetical protein
MILEQTEKAPYYQAFVRLVSGEMDQQTTMNSPSIPSPPRYCYTHGPGQKKNLLQRFRCLIES